MGLLIEVLFRKYLPGKRKTKDMRLKMKHTSPENIHVTLCMSCNSLPRLRLGSAAQFTRGVAVEPRVCKEQQATP